tara:strand:- start:1278 stop:1706 length:429 start_codon:yes stop_codon:yes gene_type:complete
MLAELAACNAAFSVIKTAISNGRELYDCGDAAKNYFANKSTIAKRVASKGKSDLDAFMALEKIKEQEEWLREHMIYAGRPDMYGDWLNFQSECKKEREQNQRIAALKKQGIIKMAKTFVTVIGLAVAVIPIIIYAIILLVKK